MKPVSLLCCHNILCKKCYTRSFLDHLTLTCPFGCKNSSKMAVDCPPYSMYLLEAMKKRRESTKVRCDAHPGRPIKYYDQKDRKYKCTECVLP
jgi:hypothetical protein